MNFPVLIGVVVALVALRFARLNPLAWLVAWWLGVYVAVRFGISPPPPSSIVTMFMGIVSLALLTYVFSDSSRFEGVKGPLVRFMIEGKYRAPRTVVVLLLPALVGFQVYRGMSQGVSAPGVVRTIHPAPPPSIAFKGETVDLVAGDNPFRHLEESDSPLFKEHVQNGRRVYFENCVFCHGDNMEGNGIFSHALNPIPASFADATTIAMLQESYLFWRIAKGAPGLPVESTPWSSAMPAWENFLTEEEIWEVILFLYDHTGQKPRALEHIE